jgi:NADH:ubiquinone oxidoreductase subunit 4 (subunit M)
MEIFKVIIGVLVLLSGIPIGNYLAKITEEELREGQKWFKIIVIASLIGGTIGLLVGNDFLIFFFFFIAIVTSRSLKR